MKRQPRLALAAAVEDVVDCRVIGRSRLGDGG